MNDVLAREGLPAPDGNIDEAGLELQRVGPASDPLRRQDRRAGEPGKSGNPKGATIRFSSCALFSISASESVVIDGEWSLFDGSIHGLGEVDGVAKPGLRRLFVRWRDASESQQLSPCKGRV